MYANVGHSMKNTSQHTITTSMGMEPIHHTALVSPGIIPTRSTTLARNPPSPAAIRFEFANTVRTQITDIRPMREFVPLKV